MQVEVDVYNFLKIWVIIFSLFDYAFVAEDETLIPSMLKAFISYVEIKFQVTQS